MTAGWKVLGALLLAALTVPAWGLKAVPPPATLQTGAPGTLNYVEGQARLGDETLNSDVIGGVILQAGETLSTSTGKAEILLLPGTFLRVGSNSAVRIGSLNSSTTAAELTAGQATVEVLPQHPSGVLTLTVNGATARLLKSGLYEMDADRGQVLVYKGEAEVQVGGRIVRVKAGHELALNASGDPSMSKFDKKAFEQSELVQFSGLRSEYLAEANASVAHTFYAGDPGWSGPGWYWTPEFWACTWVPGDNYYYNAFGWGFFSPRWVIEDPLLYTGFYGDFGIGSFGHRRHGFGRLPPTFSARPAHEPTAPLMGQPSAIASNAGRVGSGFNHSGGVNRGPAPAFNSGGSSVGGSHGGGFAGGGGHAAGGGLGGGLGGGHR